MTDPPLPHAEGEAFVAELVAVTRSQLPLAAGLRAAAAETEHRRVSKALLHVATQVEAGQKLDDILAQSPQVLPGGGVLALPAGINRAEDCIMWLHPSSSSNHAPYRVHCFARARGED